MEQPIWTPSPKRVAESNLTRFAGVARNDDRVAVEDIPRTISGKIVELAVRDVIHGRPVRNTDALANPGALGLFRNRPELAD
jgi:hypothetical protein